MPDITIAAQTRLFMQAFGFGFLLGVAYDIVRIFRLAVTQKKLAVFFQDILYFFFAGLATFLFWLAVNEGEVRFYLIAAEVMGFVVYYFSFGSFVVKWSNRIIRAVRRAVASVWHAVSAPFRWLFRLFRKIMGKFRVTSKKRVKNFHTKSKIHLKQGGNLLYNLNKIYSKPRKNLKKGGQAREESAKKT